MLIRDAIKITGGLSHTSKMPCPSWSTPPTACKTGTLYSSYKNSVCHACYAKKGMGRFPVVGRAQERRLAAWKTHPDWVEAMVLLIQKHKYFRWFDAGDIYSVLMFKDICRVCQLTPDTKHWLPTLERVFVLKNRHLIPDNLTVRFSSPIIDQLATSQSFPVSMVSTTETAVTCIATLGQKECSTCRDCWDKSISQVIYHKH